jgi:hypothetical protein
MDSKGKIIKKFKEYYETVNAGEFEPEEWRTKITEAIIQAGETELLDIIREDCGKHCAWLHTEIEISDYAMDILAGRVFPLWESGVARNVGKDNRKVFYSPD